MGQVDHGKIVILIFFLIVTSVFVYQRPSSTIANKQLSLGQALLHINEWARVETVPLEQAIVGMLQLDDYVNNYYSKGEKVVSLYIGYYFSSQKLGAVHDPLVCFPGQGWGISQAEGKKLHIADSTIYFTSMVVTKEQQKQLVLYWFQAFTKTSPNVFLQKIYTLWAQFFDGREDNAFVRVTIPITRQSVDEASTIGFEFIEELYPIFIEFVKGDSRKNGL